MSFNAALMTAQVTWPPYTPELCLVSRIVYRMASGTCKTRPHRREMHRGTTRYVPFGEPDTSPATVGPGTESAPAILIHGDLLFRLRFKLLQPRVDGSAPFLRLSPYILLLSGVCLRARTLCVISVDFLRASVPYSGRA